MKEITLPIQQLALVGLLTSILCTTYINAKHVLRSRPDLAPILEKLCNSRQFDQTESMRSAGIWDLHVEGGVITAPNQIAAQRFVEKTATKKKHSGYQLKHCGGKNKSYSFLTTISPVSFAEWRSGKSGFCKIKKIIEASALIGGSAQVNPSHVLDKSKYTSVYCKKNGVNRATYLFEPANRLHKKDFYTQLPGKGFKKTLGSLRRLAKVSPAAYLPMPKKLKKVVLDGSITHNPAVHIKTQTSLKNKLFLGEVKVFAKDWQEAVWNLWRSPSHRKVLLEKKAKNMYFAKKPLPTAKGMYQFGIIATN